MRKPAPLKPGATVRLVSPASPATPERIHNMVCFLEGEGLRVQLSEGIYARQGFLAGSDAQRAKDLQGAFDDREVDAVLCTRGGYGSARLLPMLDLDRIAATDKLFVGYSDVTSLQLALLKRGLATVYAPMGVTFENEREGWVYESFRSALFGGNPIPPQAPKAATLVDGTAEGRLMGGCLCLLADSLATPDSIDARDAILLIEDVDENPHRVDAMLTHLLLAGVLQCARGLVFGEMTRTDERFDPTIGGGSWRDIVRERVAPLCLPTVIDFPCGHMKNMLSLPLGLNVRLDANSASLVYLETL